MSYYDRHNKIYVWRESNPRITRNQRADIHDSTIYCANPQVSGRSARKGKAISDVLLRRAPYEPGSTTTVWYAQHTRTRYEPGSTAQRECLIALRDSNPQVSKRKPVMQ